MEQVTLEEGIVFNRWMYNRLIKKNQNVLGCDTGPTGSGKSYRQLRMMELWYKYYFDEPVPEHAINFEPYEVIQLIASDKLRRGDLIMFEEAGVGLNNLDFAKRHSKMMNYVLQTFRFKNYGMFFNLPYVTLLNKTARMLMHFNFESASIDRNTKINYCKPKFIQINQSTGKVYTKYPVTKVGKRYVKVKRLGYSMPSPYLVEMYERKKKEFFDNMTNNMVFDIEQLKAQEKKQYSRNELKPHEIEMYNYLLEGHSQRETAQKFGKDESNFSKWVQRIKYKGYDINKDKKRGNVVLLVDQTPISVS